MERKKRKRRKPEVRKAPWSYFLPDGDTFNDWKPSVQKKKKKKKSTDSFKEVFPMSRSNKNVHS
jgi:uncharacterized protein YegL